MAFILIRQGPCDGLICKGKLARLSIADSIFKNYFLTDQIITTAHTLYVALLGRGEASLK